MGWIENCSEALHLCCDRRGGKVEDLTTPSQRRYVQYFSMLLDCVQPRKEAFLLKSLKFTELKLEGEAPEIQVDVFNCGLLIFATRISIPADSSSVSIVCGRLIRVGMESRRSSIGKYHCSLSTDLPRRQEDQHLPLYVPHGI